MKKIVLIIYIIMSVSSFAQNEIPVKTDGTKYYIQVYDGDTNEKVLYHDSSINDWKTKIRVADYFDGSDNQLWSFEATELYPGYVSIVNHDEGITLDHHLMSWNWLAYFSDARDHLSDMEMQFKIVEFQDGYFIIETIEKPAGLYGINYTPGPDALNVKPEGYVSFSDVKSRDINSDNMANKVFKLVEFDPVSLFMSAIERSQELYDANPNVPEKIKYDLFYTMEKAREVRVFGSEAEMLAYQPILDEAVNNFKEAISLENVVLEARIFINASDASEDVKTSFNALVENIETLFKSENFDYSLIDHYISLLQEAEALVEAIVSAENYWIDLENYDEQRLSSGMKLTIDMAKTVLDNSESLQEDYNEGIALLMKKRELLDAIIYAQGLMKETIGFEDIKQTLDEEIEAALILANNANTSTEELELKTQALQETVDTFIKTVEAGALVDIENGDFENDFTRWNTVSNISWLPYIENKSLDGSQNMTIWNSSDYQFITSQTLNDVPNGLYKISVMANVNNDNSIKLFAQSGETISELPLLNEAGFTKRILEIEVSDRTLRFGIKGAGEDNTIPGSHWGMFDNFEVKWLSEIEILNPDFEDNLTGWNVDANPSGAVYNSAKGIDGSTSVTCWSGSAYSARVYQQLSGLGKGWYSISAMAQSNSDASFELYGATGVDLVGESIMKSNGLSIVKTSIYISNGNLEFGIKGSGEDNGVDAGLWVVFDQFTIKADTIIPTYPEESFTPSIKFKESSTSQVYNNVDVWQDGNLIQVRSSSSAISGYSLYSIDGIVLEKKSVNAYSLSIPVKKGIYVIMVQTKDGVVKTKKVVVQ